MKRISVLLVILLLAACKPTPAPTDLTPTPGDHPSAGQTKTPEVASAQNTPTRPVTPTPHPDLQVALEELDGARLLFWHPWSGEMGQAVESIVSEFNQTNLWGIQVFTNPAGGSGALVSRLESSLDDGPLPHIVAAPSEQILYWQEKLSLFTDLNPYIQDNQWGLSGEERASIPRLYWEQDSSDGRQTGMPAVRDMRVIFYNESWGKELGFNAPPQTFATFSEQACDAAQEREDLDQTGGWIIDTNPRTALSWILTGNPPPIHDPDQDIYQFDSKSASDALAKLRKMHDDGCAWISRLPDPYQYFADRQALMYSGSLADVQIQSEWMRARNNPDDWTILPFPEAGGKPVVLVSGSSYAVLQATPAEQLASWLFVRWLILPRHQALLSEASGLLPVSVSAEKLLESYGQRYPQWETALGWVPVAQSVPQGGSWTIVQTILEDAAWQTYQSFMELEDIPLILEQVDQLIPEVLSIESDN